MYRVFLDYYQQGYHLGDILETYFRDTYKKISRGDCVLIKPNMFSTVPYFYIHPQLIIGITEFFYNLGAKIVIGERLSTFHDVLKPYPNLLTIADLAPFEDFPTENIEISGATSLRQIIAVPSIILECDFFIGMPQFRTHAGVIFSNALKNLVGILPGYTTRAVHNVGLTEAIVDLNRIRPQDLVISDFITTIEGNYPVKGIPEKRNRIMIGNNALAVDMVTQEIAGFSNDDISYIEFAKKAGLGPVQLEEIEFIHNLDDCHFSCYTAGKINHEIGKDIELNYESACPECQRYCHSLINHLLDTKKPSEKINIVSGNAITEASFTGYSAKDTLLVGNCTYKYRENGVYLEGCPPRAIQVLAVHDWVYGKGVVRDKYKNQCRWPYAMI